MGIFFFFNIFLVKCSNPEGEEAILGNNKERKGGVLCREHTSRDLTGVHPVKSAQREEVICTRSDVYQGSDLGFSPTL